VILGLPPKSARVLYYTPLARFISDAPISLTVYRMYTVDSVYPNVVSNKGYPRFLRIALPPHG
jgi:hypothetical protein